MAQQFMLEGYNVLVASGGHEAIDIIRNKGTDIVITDVRMPNGDGEQLLRSMKREFCDIPLVMVSGFSELTREQALALGAADLLKKPVDISVIESYIKICVGKITRD